MQTVTLLPEMERIRVSPNLRYRHVNLTLAARNVLLLQRVARSLCLL